MKPREEILADIDATLDQLIHNAEVAQDVCSQPLFEDEMKALQKTQESLLARLINMSDLLDSARKKQHVIEEPIQAKIVKFSKLNTALINNVAETFGTKKTRTHKKRNSLKP